MTKITIEKFREALKGSMGIYHLIATRLGVDRRAICVFVEKNPELKEAIEVEKEKWLDTVEGILLRLAQKKNPQAVKFLSSYNKVNNKMSKNVNPI